MSKLLQVGVKEFLKSEKALMSKASQLREYLKAKKYKGKNKGPLTKKGAQDRLAATETQLQLLKKGLDNPGKRVVPDGSIKNVK